MGWLPFHLSHTIHLLMVVVIIDDKGVSACKLKKNSPITGDIHSKLTFFVPGQFVQVWSRVIHVFYFICSMKAVKNSFESISVFRSDSFLLTGKEKIFTAFMLEWFDHKSDRNLSGYTNQGGIIISFGLIHCDQVAHEILHIGEGNRGTEWGSFSVTFPFPKNKKPERDIFISSLAPFCMVYYISQKLLRKNIFSTTIAS